MIPISTDDNVVDHGVNEAESTDRWHNLRRGGTDPYCRCNVCNKKLMYELQEDEHYIWAECGDAPNVSYAEANVPPLDSENYIKVFSHKSVRDWRRTQKGVLHKGSTVTSHYVFQCLECSGMEEHILQARINGARFIRFNPKNRCKCGCVLVVGHHAEMCVSCWKIYRMLGKSELKLRMDLKIFIAERKKLNEAIKEIA